MDTQDLSAIDDAHVWHPFTQQRGWVADEPKVFIERAYGCTLVDTDGNEYIDGVSSLWCNIHGHGHPAIDQAIRDQLDRVAHSTMLGLSHPPATELAARVIDIAPDGLSRVFYSDNGATANEIALKMAFQSFAQNGEHQRSKFVYLDMSYHGDTIGAVSVGGIPLFHTTYHPLLFDAIAVPSGDTQALANVLARDGETIAAVIVEPLVQGAAGILLQPPGYLKAVRDLCTEHGVLLIVDEVATGFGRTGKMFACDHEGVTPDLMTVAKGITGGYLPLAATLTTESVYDAFLGEFEQLRTFFHGHTYTGNPLACAAALATLDIFENEDTLANLQPKIALLEQLIAEEIEPLPAVSEIRQLGFVAGIELVDFPLESRMGHQVTLAARAAGAIVRPLGDIVVLMPPLSITEDELRSLVSITAAAIADATSA
jgi:adenosylmethionine-8-amino-7-oxononanoate aminotransferase